MENTTDTISMIGLSHKTTPTSQILPLKNHEDETASLIWEKLEPQGLIVLATCNRFEAYIQAPADNSLLEKARGLPPFNAFPNTSVLMGREAVRHLFRVASGLESAILGDHEVLGQVRKALDKYTRRGMVKPNSVLHQVFLKAIHVGSRVRRETGISQGRIGYPALALRRILIHTPPPRRIMVLGWGKASRSFLRKACQEASRGDEVIVVTRRRADQDTPGKCLEKGVSVRIARPEEPWLWKPVPGRNLGLLVASSRLRHLAGNAPQPTIVVDLTIHEPSPTHTPQSRAPIVGMRQLEEEARSLQQSRLSQVPRAEEIIEEELRALTLWYMGRDADRVIAELMKYAHSLGQREALRASRLPPESLSNGVLVTVFDSFARKLLHPVIEALRDTARGEDVLESLERKLSRTRVG